MLSGLDGAGLPEPSLLTIGSFDGVHRGHRALIEALVARARIMGALAGLITFSPHPRDVLNGPRDGLYLMTLEEKLAILATMGLDFLVIMNFTAELASVSARDFLSSVRENLNMRELWVGPGFALGRGREGHPDVLEKLGEELGFGLKKLGAFMVDGEAVSSTRVRDLIGKGDVVAAAALLGRYPSHRGPVVRGAVRGRALGFPTANLSVDPKRVIPARGVYAVLAKVAGEVHKGVANIGVRPSFDRGEVNIEVHLLDFNREIYGRVLEVQFVQRLREERRFESPRELASQIGADVLMARQVLGEL